MAFFKILFLSFLVFDSTRAQRQLTDAPSLREACRQAIGGQYLAAFNEEMRLNNLVSSMHQRLRDYSRKIRQAETNLKAAKQRQQSAKINLEERLKYQEQIRFTDTLRSFRKETQTFLDQAKNDWQRAKKIFTDLDQRVRLVFTITTHKDQGKIYPFSLEYISSCPKFRSLCPLPSSHIEKLKGIMKDMPLSCNRYANLK